MKVQTLGLALALPIAAGCGQVGTQNAPLETGAAPLRAPAALGHVQPNTCNVAWQGGTAFSGMYVRLTACGGFNGRFYYGSGSTPGRKLTSTTSTSNPGGVPVPPGETPVLFDQMLISPNNPGALTFTVPSPVPPYSRIAGVPLGVTYHLYAYNNGALQTGFPISLGTPTPAGALRFTSPPYSPLPMLPALTPGTTISFELATP